MGSKRSMLRNGLGKLIIEQAANADRLVDLFCGAASVAWFAAENTRLPILATDLQEYATVMARSVISRCDPVDPSVIGECWLKEVAKQRQKSPMWSKARELPQDGIDVATKARKLCQEEPAEGLIWRSYGGFYFSPLQAISLDCMIRFCPEEEPIRSVCLAATVSAASRCAAAPGHTAQPFQPTPTANRFIIEAWKKDPLDLAERLLSDICPRHASSKGQSFVADAEAVAATLGPKDLVFVDPPYSGVQYSRFYHVLETIARGNCEEVSGIGRYPPLEDRPQSAFSNKGTSLQAVKQLISKLAGAGSTVIFTFPAGECSNGLSGSDVKQAASQLFDITEQTVNSQFSTLGGNNGHRASRKSSSEMILLMVPKK